MPLPDYWAKIPGHEAYEVSTSGVVRSVKTKHPLKGEVSKSGYHRVRLYRCPGDSRLHSVHRLVLLAFVGLPADPAKYQVSHRNGNGLDNRLENLEWSTALKNIRLKAAHGTQSRGESHGRSKLTDKDVLRIRELRSKGVSGTVLAKEYGVTTGTISAVYRGRFWTHLPTDVEGGAA